MTKLRFLAAIFALATLAACGDIAPTAPESDQFRPPCGFLGSGC